MGIQGGMPLSPADLSALPSLAKKLKRIAEDIHAATAADGDGGKAVTAAEMKIIGKDLLDVTVEVLRILVF